MALAAGAAVGSAALPVAMYKDHSEIVRWRTAAMSHPLKQLTHFDVAGNHHIATLKETHPFGFVDRKGNVVLVPKTRFQTALQKAQRTFLKHLIPARYRFNLTHKEEQKSEEPRRPQRWLPRLIRGGREYVVS